MIIKKGLFVSAFFKIAHQYKNVSFIRLCLQMLYGILVLSLKNFHITYVYMKKLKYFLKIPYFSLCVCDF